MRRSLTEKILTNPNILFHELPFLWKAYSPKKPFDRDRIKEKIAEMDRYNLQKNLRASLCTGYEVIWDFSFIKEKKETTYPTVFLDENLWQEVLQEWQEQEKRFKEADLKQYPNLFNKENIIEEKAREELTD